MTLVATVVSAKDAPTTIEQLQWIQELGGCQSYPYLLVFSGEVQIEQREEIERLAGDCFASVAVENFTPKLDQWPEAANEAFAFVADYCSAQGSAGFFFMEPDQTPIRVGWLGELDAMFTSCGKPAMGVIATKDGPNTTPKRYFLNGTAFYAGNIGEIVNRIYLSDLGTPFDSLISSILIGPKGTNPSLAHHCPQMLNYRESTGYFTHGTEIWCSQGKVHDDTLIVHGCKDGSLVNLLRERLLQHS